MKRKLLVALGVLLMSVSSPAIAGDFGTADEAKAMLEKAVAAVKANKADRSKRPER